MASPFFGGPCSGFAVTLNSVRKGSAVSMHYWDLGCTQVGTWLCNSDICDPSSNWPCRVLSVDKRPGHLRYVAKCRCHWPLARPVCAV